MLPVIRALAAIVFVAIATIPPVDVAAQEGRSILSPDRSSLTAQEGRELRAQIARLEETTGLQAATLEGIAERCGIANRNITAAALFRCVEQGAEQAAELNRQLETLEVQVANLREAARDRAAEALARAQAAFDSGDFASAEAEFGTLYSILSQQTGDGAGLLLDALNAQAAAAELQGSREDYARARAYRNAWRAGRRAAFEAENWEVARNQVLADIRQAELFNDAMMLESAMTEIEQHMLPISDPEQTPLRWGIVHRFIGQIIVRQAQMGSAPNENAALNAAFDAFAVAIAALETVDDPFEMAEVQTQAANLLVILAARNGGDSARELSNEAIRTYRVATEMYTRGGNPDRAAETINNIALTNLQLARISDQVDAATFLDMAIDYGEQALGFENADFSPEALGTVHTNLCNARQERAQIYLSDPVTREAGLALLDGALVNCDAAISLVSEFTQPTLYSRMLATRAVLHLRRAVNLSGEDRLLAAQSGRADGTVSLALFEQLGLQPEASFMRQIMAALQQFEQAPED